MNDHLNEHRPLNRAKSFEFTTLDAATVPLAHQFSFKKKTSSQGPSRKTSSILGSSRKTSSLGPSRKTSKSSYRKKSEVMIVPSLQAVERTAPNARYCDSIKTLFRWRGSIYKLVWRHFVTYYVLYVSLTVLYEFVLDENGRRHFEALTRYISKSASTLNLMIMLGFFTATALQRLLAIQTAIPGTAKTISSFLMSLKIDLPEGTIIVFQYARWAVLSWILACRSVSVPLRDKYPDMISLQRKGILRPYERLILERAETDGDTTPRPLIVIDWMLLLLKECFKYGRYNSKSSHHKNVEILMAFKKSCGNMIKFATRNMPHAVIQAVIIAVYYFGLVTMLARDLSTLVPIPHQSDGDAPLDSLDSGPKYMDNGRPDHDEIVKTIILYFPVMPLMQFFIFFAWLTFGRMAVNPFGEDETDIDLESVLEAHIEDYKRLGTLYTQNLEDLFPDLPQKRFFDAALEALANKKDQKDKSESKTKAQVDPLEIPVTQPTTSLHKVASSPVFGAFSVFRGTPRDGRRYREPSPFTFNRNSTAITIDDDNIQMKSLIVPID